MVRSAVMSVVPEPSKSSGARSAASLCCRRAGELSVQCLDPSPGWVQAEVHSRGPISCGISATMALDRYSGGIFQQYKPDANINHIISVVGWGEEEDVPFWWVSVRALQDASTSQACTGCRRAQELTPRHACCAVQRMGGPLGAPPAAMADSIAFMPLRSQVHMHLPAHASAGAEPCWC